MRRTCLPFLIALTVPIAARGETIYAFSRDVGHVDHRLLRFDSASPWELEQSLPITGDINEFTEISLEFDPVTRELYGFGFWQCQILCPAIAIDLDTGETQGLGTIATQPGAYVSGIAVAPPRLTSGAPEIPALSHIGLAALSLLLAIAALWRFRFDRS